MNDPKTWFRPKRIGWGWSPNTWEGWLVIASSAVVVLIATVAMLRGAAI